MTKPVLSSRRILVGLALVLAVNSQLNTRHLGWVGTVPNALVKTLADPPGYLLRNALGGVKGDPPTLSQVEPGTSYEALREALDRAELLNRALTEELAVVRRERDAYSAAASARGSESIRLLQAGVADANLSRTNPTLELDQGSRSGVEPGDPVVLSANLLGFVSEDVGALRSSARLVTAPGSRFQVRFVTPGRPFDPDSALQVVELDADGGYFFCDLAKGRHTIAPGQLASMADDLYRQAYGYFLGEVVEVRDHPDKPLELERIVIRFAADPTRLRRVYIQVEE